VTISMGRERETAKKRQEGGRKEGRRNEEKEGGKRGFVFWCLPVLPRGAVEGNRVSFLVRQELQNTLDRRARVIQQQIVEEGETGVVDVIKENGAGATTGPLAHGPARDEEEGGSLREGAREGGTDGRRKGS